MESRSVSKWSWGPIKRDVGVRRTRGWPLGKKWAGPSWPTFWKI